MAGGVIAYRLVIEGIQTAKAALDKFTAASKASEGQMAGLGGAVNAAEKALGGASAGANALAGALDNVARNSANAKAGLSQVTAAANQAANAHAAAISKMATSQGMIATSARGERYAIIPRQAAPGTAEYQAALAAADEYRAQAAARMAERDKGFAAQGMVRDKVGNWVPKDEGGGKGGTNLLGKVGGVIAGYYGAKMTAHGVDHILQASDDLEQYRRKWNALNENHQMLDKVIEQTRDVSRKHKVMDRIEVAHLADELRGNLGSLEQASHHLDDAAREVARRKRQMIAHGHLNTEEAVRDISAISKSAEIGVSTTGKTPEEYGRAFTEFMRKLNIATMTANIRPEEYLGAQRLIGSTAFQNMNDRMKFGFLPSFVQENQKRAGFMWQQFDQRFFAGKGFSAPAMNELYGLGLVNIDPATTPDKFNPKTGLPKAQQDPRSFKEGERLMKDKLDWIWNVLEPAMEKKYGDDPLRNAQAAAMFMSPRAAGLFGEVVSQHAKWVRNIAQQERAWKGRERPEDLYSLGLSRNRAMRDAHGKDGLLARQRGYYSAAGMETDEPFEGYRQAKMHLSASLKNFEVALKDIKGPATQGLNRLAGMYEWLEQQVSETGRRATRKRWNLPEGGFAGSTKEEMDRWWRGDGAVLADQQGGALARIREMHDHSGMPHQALWARVSRPAENLIRIDAPQNIVVQVTGDVNLPGLGQLKFGGTENLPISAASRGQALQPNAQTP